VFFLCPFLSFCPMLRNGLITRRAPREILRENRARAQYKIIYNPTLLQSVCEWKLLFREKSFDGLLNGRAAGDAS
jgi:hypothetical protein